MANYALRIGADPLPSWYIGSALNTWTSLGSSSIAEGTGGLSQQALNAFSGWAVRQETSQIYIGPVGGHDDGTNNCMIGCNLQENSPEFTLLAGGSASTNAGWAYGSDGKPASRHTYQHSHWSEARQRVMLIGARFLTGTQQQRTVDGFDPVTGEWDSPNATRTNNSIPLADNSYNDDGFYPLVPTLGAFGNWMDGDGRVWTNSFDVFDPSTKLWSAPSITGYSPINNPRWPQVYAPSLGIAFALQYGNGEGADSGLTAVKLNPTTGVRSQITWSAGSSSAVSAITAATPAYAAMDWDVENSWFLFFAGSGNIYKIIPNSGTEWDMEIYSPSGTLPTLGSGGLNRRFSYLPMYKGFVCQPDGAQPLYFLRTA